MCVFGMFANLYLKFYTTWKSSNKICKKIEKEKENNTVFAVKLQYFIYKNVLSSIIFREIKKIYI